MENNDAYYSQITEFSGVVILKEKRTFPLFNIKDSLSEYLDFSKVLKSIDSVFSNSLTFKLTEHFSVPSELVAMIT